MGNQTVNKRAKWAVPDDVMMPVVSNMHVDLSRCCDNFVTYELELLRERCGPKYAGVPLDDIRRQAINLRKRGVLSPVDGHGPSVTPALSDEYKAILKSPEFRDYFIKLSELFGCRCAVCNNGGHIEPHHRTYERLGHEDTFDCIPVCRKCHKVCDTRRRRQAARPDDSPSMFLKQ